MNNKQSSVEMIEEFLLSHCNPTICNVEWDDFKLMLEQAKAMHKDEMVEFCYLWSHERADKIDIEHDYNETFGE